MKSSFNNENIKQLMVNNGQPFHQQWSTIPSTVTNTNQFYTKPLYHLLNSFHFFYNTVEPV